MAHASCVALQPVEVDTGTSDRDGFLVFVDNALVAVLVRLEDKEHGAMRGQWLLEVGFGRCNATPQTSVFKSPDDAQKWVLKRLSKLI